MHDSDEDSIYVRTRTMGWMEMGGTEAFIGEREESWYVSEEGE